MRRGASGPWAIQLYFDHETDATVRALWHRLAELNITRHLHTSANRPHLTLAIYANLEFARAETQLVAFAAARAPFLVTFAHVGVFAQPSSVVFLAPVVTPDLLNLHRVTNETFSGIGTGPDPLYLPGRWVPHCTVALHLEPQTLPLSVSVVQALSLPMTGTVSEMGIGRVSPTAPLVTVPLGTPRRFRRCRSWA